MICADYLEKKTSGHAVKVRRYHRRYFVLAKGMLLYGGTDKDEYARGRLHLGALTACNLLEPTPDRCFPLLMSFSDGTALKLRAEHHDTATRWVAALQATVGTVRQQRPLAGAGGDSGAAADESELEVLQNAEAKVDEA